MRRTTALLIRGESRGITGEEVADLLEFARAALAYRGLIRRLLKEAGAASDLEEDNPAIAAAGKRLDEAGRVHLNGTEIYGIRLFEQYAEIAAAQEAPTVDLEGNSDHEEENDPDTPA